MATKAPKPAHVRYLLALNECDPPLDCWERLALSVALIWLKAEDGSRLRPAVATWAKHCGLSPRGLRKIIRRLEARGILHPVRKSIGGRSNRAQGLTNEWRVSLPNPEPGSGLPESRPGTVRQSTRNGTTSNPEPGSPEPSTEHNHSNQPGSQEAPIADAKPIITSRPPSAGRLAGDVSSSRIEEGKDADAQIVAPTPPTTLPPGDSIPLGHDGWTWTRPAHDVSESAAKLRELGINVERYIDDFSKRFSAESIEYIKAREISGNKSPGVLVTVLKSDKAKARDDEYWASVQASAQHDHEHALRENRLNAVRRAWQLTLENLPKREPRTPAEIESWYRACWPGSQNWLAHLVPELVGLIGDRAELVTVGQARKAARVIAQKARERLPYTEFVARREAQREADRRRNETPMQRYERENREHLARLSATSRPCAPASPSEREGVTVGGAGAESSDEPAMPSRTSRETRRDEPDPLSPPADAGPPPDFEPEPLTVLDRLRDMNDDHCTGAARSASVSVGDVRV